MAGNGTGRTAAELNGDAFRRTERRRAQDIKPNFAQSAFKLD
jgi:hypothetical protein